MKLKQKIGYLIMWSPPIGMLGFMVYRISLDPVAIKALLTGLAVTSVSCVVILFGSWLTRYDK
jgi:hypothetical protein